MTKRKTNQKDIIEWQIKMQEKRLDNLKENLKAQLSTIDAYMKHPSLSNAVREIKNLHSIATEAEIALRQHGMLREILLTDEEEKQAIQAPKEQQVG